MNSEILSKYLINQESKQKWYIGFNDAIKKSIINNIVSMPAKKLLDKNSDFWFFDHHSHKIRINYKFNDDINPNKLREILLNAAAASLQKCVLDYKGLSNDEINDYASLFHQKLLLEQEDSFNKVKARRYQHLFSKEIKDRDNKCIICCLETPDLLEACHIKPFSLCSLIDKYNSYNGITLCKNHHKLFDSGLFTFDDKWKVIISSKFNENDKNLLFKTFEPRFVKIPNKYIFNNVYIKFHRSNVFIN